jgi:hypothetical protein
MVDENPEYDVYVFLTQDAYLADPSAIIRITEPFLDPKVGAVCGRQLPHYDATPFAAHARLFNYPDKIQVKTFADIPALGIKLDACPGRLNQTAILTKREGLFYGQCSEICGIHHGFMPIALRSVD